MACLEMYKNSEEHRGGGSNGRQYTPCNPMSPRISFSNDFVEIKPDSGALQARQAEVPPVVSSPDFEFSVTSYSMMTADELFFKGKLLPLRETKGGSQGQRTLREELLVEEEDDDDQFSLRPHKGSSAPRWRGLLSLRRAHIGSKKADQKISHEQIMRCGESKTNVGLVHEELNEASKTPQEELMRDQRGSDGSGDIEFGI